MAKRTMSSPLVATRSQVSPGALPLRPGAAPTGVAPTGSNASQTPMEGMALELEGEPDSSIAWVTMVRMRLPRTGKVNQSLWPTWLSRPTQRPPVGHNPRLGLGADSVVEAGGRRARGGDGDGLRAACREVGEGERLQRAGWRDLALNVRSDGIRQDVKRVNGLEGDLISG